MDEAYGYRSAVTVRYRTLECSVRYCTDPAAPRSEVQEEDHHLYHTKGYTRELWIESLGLPAVLPPPEERKKVETAIGAARAENLRDDMLRSKH